MKITLMLCTVMLCLGTLLAYGQQDNSVNHSAEGSFGFVRGTNKLHDLQASPLQYFTNYNGIKGDYRRLTPKNHWYIGIEAGLGEMIAPSLGKREFRFEEGGDSFYLVPTLYRGSVSAQYLRLIEDNDRQKSFLGARLKNSFSYADGLAMNIWAMNLTDVSVAYEYSRQFGNKHLFEANVSLPVLAYATRMPYSNVVSQPDKSQSGAFLEGGQWTWLGQYFYPDIEYAYQFSLSKKNAIRVTYRYRWLNYSQPIRIQMSDHQLGLAYVYKFKSSN
ncbi:MAG TPA: hypothetical protein VK957_18695 [Lunatimonas sp.]|nr:hypothetical protein [Lunatimonas sp.]